MKLRVGPLVATWYAASIAAIWTAKIVLQELACPATLAAVQFAVAAAGTRCLLPSSSRGPLSDVELRAVRGVSLTYTLGFLLTNAAIAAAAPSFVETVKAAEPLTTVALAGLVLGERERPATLLALLPIVAGVATACSGGGAFSATGGALALASNVAFSGRAVLTKSLKRRHAGSPAARSDACLFYHVARGGLLVLLPTALILEARPLLASAAGGSAAGAARVACLFAANGAAHALYNGVSFAVLARVSIATHAVLNILRRVLVIGAAAAVFATPLSAANCPP